MNKPAKTRVDILLGALKNNPLVSIVIVCAIVVSAIASFTDAIGKISSFVSPKKATSNIEVVAVTCVTSTGRPPELDISFRNIGEQVALVTDARVHVKKTWEVKPFCPRLSALPPSNNYAIKLPQDGAPYTVSPKSPVRHSLEKNKTDRFTIQLDDSIYVDPAAFLISVELVYDGDSKTASSRELLFIVEGKGSAVELRKDKYDEHALKEIEHLYRTQAGVDFVTYEWLASNLRTNVHLARQFSEIECEKSSFAQDFIRVMLESEF